MNGGLSVVIPTHRRPDKLAGCLEALAASDYPSGKLEVVVVEDGGPTPELDELRAMVQAPERGRDEARRGRGEADGLRETARALGRELERSRRGRKEVDKCCLAVPMLGQELDGSSEVDKRLVVAPALDQELDEGAKKPPGGR